MTRLPSRPTVMSPAWGWFESDDRPDTVTTSVRPTSWKVLDTEATTSRRVSTGESLAASVSMTSPLGRGSGPLAARGDTR